MPPDQPEGDQNELSFSGTSVSSGTAQLRVSERTLRRIKKRRKAVQSTEDLEKADIASRNALRKFYGWSLLGILAAQIVFVDLVFWKYAEDGKDWDVDATVMNAWLAAAVVQVIGITTVVVRNLFPRRDQAAGDATPNS